MWSHKRPQIAILTLRKKNKTGGITFTDFKIYYEITELKQYGATINTEVQTDGTELRIQKYPCIYGQLFFDKGDKNTQGKDSLFNKQRWES